MFLKIYPKLKLRPDPNDKYSDIIVDCNKEKAIGSKYICSKDEAVAEAYSPKKEKPLNFKSKSIYNWR